MQNLDASQIFQDSRVAELAAAAASANLDHIRAVGADSEVINGVGIGGATPLMWALLNQSKDGFKALLALGADVSITDQDGDSILYFAACNQDSDFLQWLLDHGVEIDIKNELTGETAIFYAAKADRTSNLSLLIAAGGNLDARDKLGDTALHKSALLNRYQSTLALLAAGADPMMVNAAGDTFTKYLAIGPEHALLSQADRAAQRSLIDWLDARTSITLSQEGRLYLRGPEEESGGGRYKLSSEIEKNRLHIVSSD